MDLALDPALRLLIEAGDPADEVAVLMRLAGPGAGPPHGARVVSRFGAIATVRTQRGQLAAMHARSEVLSLKAGRLYGAEAEPGRRRRPATHPRTGPSPPPTCCDDRSGAAPPAAAW